MQAGSQGGSPGSGRCLYSQAGGACGRGGPRLRPSCGRGRGSKEWRMRCVHAKRRMLNGAAKGISGNGGERCWDTASTHPSGTLRGAQAGAVSGLADEATGELGVVLRGPGCGVGGQVHPTACAQGTDQRGVRGLYSSPFSLLNTQRGRTQSCDGFSGRTRGLGTGTAAVHVHACVCVQSSRGSRRVPLGW